MIPQEKQVCSLGQSKKLVEIGAVLDTIWYWVEDRLNRTYLTTKDKAEDKFFAGYEIYPAPNVAELGEVLPVSIGVTGGGWLLEISKADFTWLVCYKYGEDWLWEYELYETEAQARCVALIWLIRNGYIKVEDLKL